MLIYSQLLSDMFGCQITDGIRLNVKSSCSMCPILAKGLGGETQTDWRLARLTGKSASLIEPNWSGWAWCGGWFHSVGGWGGAVLLTGVRAISGAAAPGGRSDDSSSDRLIFKGTLHPFALSFVSLETQSYFWMVLHHSIIFPWDGRDLYLPLTLPALNDAKWWFLRHSNPPRGWDSPTLQTYYKSVPVGGT